VRRLSLRHTLSGHDPEQQTAYSEIYPPLNFVKAIESRQPELLERYRCLATRRAVVRPGRPAGAANAETLKLIAIDDRPEEVYSLTADPLEESNRFAQEPALVAAYNLALEQMVGRATREKEAVSAGATLDLDDELLRQRLRGLGYME